MSDARNASGCSPTISLGDYSPVADGVTDDTPALFRCFTDAAIAASMAGAAVVTIPPGTYAIAGVTPIPLASSTTVFAHGARFILPRRLGDRARVVVFEGRDLCDFHWEGGHFQGFCFDPDSRENTWEPNASARVFAISTSPGGTTSDLLFRGIRADGVAGAVVNVHGCMHDHDGREVDTYADNVSVEACNFTRCGKFMWDYGFLWQRIVWPEEYTRDQVELAHRYFHTHLIREQVAMDDGETRVRYDAAPGELPAADEAGGRPGDGSTVCFYGDVLPANVVRGKRYHIVGAGTGWIHVADTPEGEPIRFQGRSGPAAKLIHSLHKAYFQLYAPHGCGPGKGGVDLVACRNSIVTGCRLSALGDTMHIRACDTTVFSGNQIVGSRMGAFFLAEWCRNSTVVGNTVDGTNGSRVMSVEKSNEDVTIMGNTFRGGGRGSWINQPRNLVMQGNIFINNTTKCERDSLRGRRSYETGDYEIYPEIYFTLHEDAGTYGPVIVRDNVIVTGPECREAIAFGPNGHDITVEGNAVSGGGRAISVDPSCTRVCAAGQTISSSGAR